MSDSGQKLICVIGAGSSGITAVKECIDAGFEVICYEFTDSVGGLWKFRDEDIEGVPSVTKNTIINTSKEMSAYSDFPPDENYPNYMPNKDMCRYFEQYAQHFNVYSKIRFNHQVVKVVFNDDYEKTGKWRVTVLDRSSQRTFDTVFDGVMIASGHHVKPIIPKFPDQELFKGTIMHSHSYKTWHQFEDKVVVVVGIGNSGGDAAVELSRVCSQVYLVTRSGCWVVTRCNIKGAPLDTIYSTRAMVNFTRMLPFNLACSFYERILNSYFDHKLYGLNPKHRVLSQHPTFNDLIANCLLNGKVIIRNGIQRFTENGIIFEGMTQETKCDAVVLCTGYEIAFPFLDPSIISVDKKNRVNLFKNVFQPKLKHPHTLAVIGLVQPLGAIFPIAELHSRWFCLLMKGERKLPSKERMLKIIREDVERNAKRYYESTRHTIQVDWVACMDEIATFVGSKPNLFTIALTDPKLWYQMFFGPCLPYQYRLTGPNPWSGAREAIMTYEKRLKAPFQR